MAGFDNPHAWRGQRVAVLLLVSQKLIIILAVQSALVLGIGGVALGMSAHEPAPAPHKKSKKKPPPPAESEEEDETAAHEEEAPKKAKHKPAHAEAEPDEPKGHAASAEKHETHAAEPEHPAPPAKSAKHPAEPEHPAPPAKGAKHPEPEHGEPPKLAAGPKDSLEAFAWLDEGNTRWTQGHVKSRDLVAVRERLAARFEPWAMVVSCGDGRAVPEAVFDAGPGSVVSVSTPSLEPSASFLTMIERPLKQFSPKVVVILGHAGCGKGDPGAMVTRLAEKVMSGKLARKRLEASELLVLRATYDLSSGRVRWLDSEESDGHAQSAAAVPSGHH